MSVATAESTPQLLPTEDAGYERPEIVEFPESAYRKDGLVLDDTNSIPVVLADGQEWRFPKIFIRLRPTFQGGRPTEARLYSTLNEDFDALLKESHEVTARSARGEAEDPEFVLACVRLAACMLSIHYDLPDEALEEILMLPQGDDSGPDWIRDVMAVANGRHRPKGRSSPGDGIAS